MAVLCLSNLRKGGASLLVCSDSLKCFVAVAGWTSEDFGNPGKGMMRATRRPLIPLAMVQRDSDVCSLKGADSGEAFRAEAQGTGSSPEKGIGALPTFAAHMRGLSLSGLDPPSR